MYWSEDAAVGDAAVEFTLPRRGAIAAVFMATVALFAPAAVVVVAKRTAKTTTAETWTTEAEKAIGEGTLFAWVESQRRSRIGLPACVWLHTYI